MPTAEARILIAGTQAEMANLLSREFSSYRVEIVEIASLTTVVDENPDRIALVILELPQGNGNPLTVCQDITKHPGYPSFSILLLSPTFQNPQNRLAAFQAGATVVQPLPVAEEELIAQVKALLKLTGSEEYQNLSALQDGSPAGGKSKSDYQLIVDSILPLIWIARPDGKVEYFNKRWREYTGVTLEELRNNDRLDLIHPEDLTRAKRKWELSLQYGQPYQMEYRLRKSDGSFRWFLGRAAPLKNEQGEIIKWFGTSTDIDEQKKLESTLRQEREFLNAVLETINEGVVVCNAEGRLTLLNHVARDYTVNIKLDRPIADWIKDFQLCQADGVTPLDSEQMPLLKALLGKIIPETEIVITNSPLGSRQILVRAQPLFDAAGKNIGAVSTFRDITEHRLLQQQYIRAQKMEAIGQLAGGIAHDFNNLLTVINGYCQVMLADLSIHHPFHEQITEINKAGEQATNLTRQLLAFGRRQALSPTLLDFNKTIRETEKMLSRMIGEDIRLTTQLQQNLGKVRADAGQLEQVLLNLAINARDAMPEGGRLHLETHNVLLDEHHPICQLGPVPGPYVLLKVTDTGHGIKPEVMAHIFEPFFTTKEMGKGTGLGLATVYGIVKQSGGHIDVQSQPDQGTTFDVYFPLVQDQGKSMVSDSAKETPPRGSETILIVEDEENVRTFLQHILRSYGYQVLEARDGMEAIQVCQENKQPIHLLLTDVIMPKLGGTNLAEQLLAERPNLKVLFMSGYTNDAIVRTGVLEKEKYFLQKPFEPTALIRKIRESLDAEP